MLERAARVCERGRREAAAPRSAEELIDRCRGEREIAEVAAGLDGSFSALAAAKGLALEVSVVGGDAKLEADRGRLDQILLNLVANAIKFTAGGSVGVELSTEDGHAVFRVRDTGIGIPADELERIFDAFHQAKAGGERPEGTGLGLSIARRLATLMGGDIAVDSTPGRGSTFTLCIPLAYTEAPRRPRSVPAAGPRAAAPPAPPAEPPAPASFADDRDAFDPARRTVLVIEDDEHFSSHGHVANTDVNASLDSRSMRIVCLVSHRVMYCTRAGSRRRAGERRVASPRPVRVS